MSSTVIKIHSNHDNIRHSRNKWKVRVRKVRVRWWWCQRRGFLTGELLSMGVVHESLTPIMTTADVYCEREFTNFYLLAPSVKVPYEGLESVFWTTILLGDRSVTTQCHPRTITSSAIDAFSRTTHDVDPMKQPFLLPLPSFPVPGRQSDPSVVTCRLR